MSASEAKPVVIHVSTRGNDAWSGTLPEANADGTDGPLATPAAAQALARRRKGRGERRRSVRIVLRGGLYVLDEPLRLTGADSGALLTRGPRRKGFIEGDASITWCAYPGETPILSAGRRITEWRTTTVHGRRAWVADLPEVTRGRWAFRQLFVNGRRAPRTRLPKRGLYRVEEVLDYVRPPQYPWRCPTRRIRFRKGDLKNWRNLRDVEIVALTRWIENRLPLKSVDTRRRAAAFDRPSRHTLTDEKHGGGGAPYWVENVFEALDTPGQWYLDRAKGRLVYLPKRGETPENTEVIAPAHETVLRIEGTARHRVSNVRFERIAFAHAEWRIPKGWCGSNQAAHQVPGAVVMTHAREVTFANCAVERVGTYALDVRDGCLDVTVDHCRLTDLGAGGVKMEEGSARTTVTDCTIAHGGRIFPSAVGVLIRHSPGNKVLHNEIFDLHYTGMSVGWVWGYAPSAATGNIIEWNHVHDIGHGLLSDMGGIYTLGMSPGTRIRFNSFHDIRCRVYGGWGIYTDEGSTDILIEKNLAYNCNRSGFHQHYGRDNVIQNNIFAFGDQEQVARTRHEAHTSFVFRRNIVYHTRGKTVGRSEPEKGCVFERNLYWNAAGRPLDFNGRTWDEWRALGQDAGSVIADPGFADPEHGDFRLKTTRSAKRIGFEPFDLADVGPRSS